MPQVKMLKKPKFDLTKLLEVHQDTGREDTGSKVDVPEDLKADRGADLGEGKKASQ